MVLKVYNTLSHKVEIFQPLENNNVLIYVCGPTVYDYSHIGHARTYIAFDVIVRYLRYKGYDTKYIVNITNIEDKIINRAKKLNEDPKELADKYEKAFFDDMEALGLEKADAYPRVTEHIQDIIKYIQVLVDKDYAYQANGDVYFDVRKAENYGVLSRQSLSDVKAGARVEPNENKKFPADFALWKAAKPGEPSWESPWGNGRPGWHIECSVLSIKYLGPQIDIHGGGQDLIFPHHENEILQSESMTGRKPFVKYWLHTGMLNLKGEKMSKSLGNIFVIGDFLKKYDAETLLFMVLSAHYRSPINFNNRTLNQASRNLERLYITIDKLRKMIGEERPETTSQKKFTFLKSLDGYKQEFIKAMDDDFNTPLALTVLFNLARKTNLFINKNPEANKGSLEKILNLFLELGGILGLLQKVVESEELTKEIMALIKERESARAEGDWEKSDRIRAELRQKGIQLEDTQEGVKWRRLRRIKH